MADTATINVRMSVDTKNAFTEFCDKVGVSASTLMNMFAKTVVRNQRVPFDVTTKPIGATTTAHYEHVFPKTAAELDKLLSDAEETPDSKLLSVEEGLRSAEESMGW